MFRGISSVTLLIFANCFMTLAWYGHLYIKNVPWFTRWGLFGIIIFSWLIALFEYFFQVPANKIGFNGNGGPFDLFQLKVIQEVISLAVFVVFAIFVFKTETMNWNHLAAFGCLILAVYFVFR